ncbi:retrotransposon protein, putative, ty1-copia subclass [Tanacetum coccineum]
MASFKYDLPLLDRDSRFSLWQVKMRALLAQMDLDDALLGHDKMPSSWTDDDKKQKDRKALSHIHLHLSNNILQEVLTKKTAAALWLKLEQICMTKDLTSKMLLKQKLFSYKLQEGGSMMDHLQVFKEIVSDLQSMEIKYDSEDLGLIILCSLPSSYSNFRDTILYSRDTLTLEEVYEALHAKEKMKYMVSSEGSSSQAEGLIIHGRQHDKNTNGNQRGRNSGHDIFECFKLKNKENKAGKTNPNSGIDFTDVFSPVVKHSSILTLLSIVAMHDYELEQLDVKTAFLHGELEEDIYMQQPKGFVIPGKENLVCKLKKSLYDLKQSPLLWYKRFGTFMLSQIAAKDKTEIEKLKGQLSNEFDMKDLDAAKKILGMEIIMERQFGKLYLSQQMYIEKVLRRFNMHNAKPVNTPLAAHFKLSLALCPQSDAEDKYMSKVPYSSAVGSLVYAMVCSRPDLSYAFSVVSRYMADPEKKHWKAV